MMQGPVRKWHNIPLRRDSRFDTYFHTLSHDLRTPLTQITGFAALLNLDESLAVAQKEYAAAIISACDELNNAVLAHLQLIESSLNGKGRSAKAGDEPPPTAGRRSLEESTRDGKTQPGLNSSLDLAACATPS